MDFVCAVSGFGDGAEADAGDAGCSFVTASSDGVNVSDSAGVWSIDVSLLLSFDTSSGTEGAALDILLGRSTRFGVRNGVVKGERAGADDLLMGVNDSIYSRGWDCE